MSRHKKDLGVEFVFHASFLFGHIVQPFQLHLLLVRPANAVWCDGGVVYLCQDDASVVVVMQRLWFVGL